MGDNCKIQNYALVYEPAVLEDGVFVGPAVVFTNDHFPRSVDPDGTLKRGDDWEAVGVTVREGASMGARSVCVAPVTIGRWALVAAGAVVNRDVPDFALVAGVPAKRLRWVGKAGVPLEAVPTAVRAAGSAPRRARSTSRRTTPSWRLDSDDRFHPAAKPIIGEEERAAVDRVIRSGMLAQGPEVAAFEAEFAEHFGRPGVCRGELRHRGSTWGCCRAG